MLLTECLLAQIRDSARWLVEAGAVFLHTREGIKTRSLVALPILVGERLGLEDGVEGPIANGVAEGEVVVDALDLVVSEGSGC